MAAPGDATIDSQTLLLDVLLFWMRGCSDVKCACDGQKANKSNNKRTDVQTNGVQASSSHNKQATQVDEVCGEPMGSPLLSRGVCPQCEVDPELNSLNTTVHKCGPLTTTEVND